MSITLIKNLNIGLFTYYSGYVKDGQPFGEGKLLNIFNKRIHIGEFKDGKLNGYGKMYENNKLIYEGYLKDNEYNGKGTQFYEDGQVRYIGDWINGKIEGCGIGYTPEGYILFKGNIKDNMFHGKINIFFKNGNINYDGEYKNGEKHGYGTLYYEDGSLQYKGYFKNDNLHGNGEYYTPSLSKETSIFKCKFRNGRPFGRVKIYFNKMVDNKEINHIIIDFDGKDIEKFFTMTDYIYLGTIYYFDKGTYIGAFKLVNIDDHIHALPHGKGKHYVNDKLVYDGYWSEQYKCGYGKYYYEDNSYYEGQFKDDMFHGAGTIFNSNGTEKFKGVWIENKFLENLEEEGKYYYDDGTYFEGKLTNGKPTNNGIIYYPDNSRYEGELNGKNRHGLGKLYYSNNVIKYDGCWYNDKFNEYGIFYDINGNIKFQGRWKNGKRMN